MSKAVFLVLLVQIFLYIGCVLGQSNSSCVKLYNCPIAVEFIKSANLSTFIIRSLRQHFCGYQDSVPEIFCERFTNVIREYQIQELLPESCGLIEGDRIFGGQEAGLYEFPWMVLISYKTHNGLQFKCGGTLINNRYVLTAAHCLLNQSIAGVRIGEHDISTDTDCQGNPPYIVCESRIQDMRVEKQIIHENYRQSPEILNDIGLVRLQKEVDFVPKNAKPICLPFTSALQEKNLTGIGAVVAGWGYTESGSVSKTLLKVRVPVSSNENCRAVYSRGRPIEIDLSKKLCAGENGRDSCAGDSGGPLMIEGQHNGVSRYIQHGIVSYGPKLCASNYPGVYTDVSKYIDWILINMRK